MASIRSGRLRILSISVAIVALLVTCALLVEDHFADRYANRQRPRLYYEAFEHDLLTGHHGTFVVAHNAGDSVIAARDAMSHGADIIEIDVIPYAGGLYAGHSEPKGRFAERWFRGSTVRDVLDATTDAEAIQFDLKSSADWYLDEVAALLNDEAYADKIFLVSSRNPATLEVLAERAPHALRALSIGETYELVVLLADEKLANMLDGVTIRETLLDAGLVEWLREQRLFINAWVVNDVRRANDLIALGVGAVTTDNLALMQAIGQPHQRDYDLAGMMRPGIE